MIDLMIWLEQDSAFSFTIVGIFSKILNTELWIEDTERVKQTKKFYERFSILRFYIYL